MDVLILAAGLGSRLSKYTLDIIPKYLININNYNGLYYLITYWSKYSRNIYLVIHSKFNILTKFYIKNILPEYFDKIIIINYDTSDGTAYTLNYLVNNDLKKYDIQNLLITWCDIFPNENIPFEKLKKRKGNKNNIFIFTNGNKCRFKLSDKNEILPSPDNDGNIIGIYYFQNFKGIMLDETSKNNDIVIFLNKLGNIYEYKLNNLFDFGDEEKYLEIISKDTKLLKCRYFNRLEILEENKILKKAVDDKGKIIIKYEIEWYQHLNKINNSTHKISFLPNIYKYFEYGYLMEYKKGYIPLYEFLNNYDTTIININSTDKNEKEIEFNTIKTTILKNISDKLKYLHNIEKKEQNRLSFFYDIKKEIYDKVITRKDVIKDLLNYFGDFIYVNDIKIFTFDVIIEKCKNIIINYYSALNNFEYNIIFGDCNFSNILINPNDINDIIFIDPRGYFGDTHIYGLKEYDYAKILYGITGYDKFNSGNFFIKNIDFEKKKIEFDIDPIQFDKKIINKYFNKVHKAFMVINWLSLAEYNKNNIWKCLASYYYGLYLGTLL
jgi:choline kinase